MTTINANVNTWELLNSKSLNTIFNYELFKVRPQDKEDVKQDCIVRILRALRDNSEVPTEKLAAFCQTIINRTVSDYYRRSYRKIEQNSTSVFFSDGYDEGDGTGDDSAVSFSYESVDYGYELSDVRADFERNRYMFTPTEQKAIEFMLSNSDSIAMSLTEIASELKINKSHTTKAFKKLREIYGA